MSRRLKRRSNILLRCALTGGLLLGAGATVAQDEDVGDDSEETMEEPEAPAESASAGGTQAPETYTVMPGDTMWDLSARFLNNPWYWPKIWSYNPELDNPNWIQPGTRIRFYPGGSEGPVQVEDDDIAIPEPENVAGFEAGGVAEYLDARNAYQGVVSRREFFVEARKIENAGSLSHSSADSTMLSAYAPVWLDLKADRQPGDVLQVFRPLRELRHPVSGSSLGTVVQVLGQVRVEAVSDGKALARLTESWDAVRRDDLVAELGDMRPTRVKQRRNQSEIKGYVVDTTRGETNAFGQYHAIFVDKGENDGVELGNTFTVVRAYDPVKGESKGLTDEVIGRIRITDVREKASVGVLPYANREIIPGDRIEMRQD